MIRASSLPCLKTEDDIINVYELHAFDISALKRLDYIKPCQSARGYVRGYMNKKGATTIAVTPCNVWSG